MEIRILPDGELTFKNRSDQSTALSRRLADGFTQGTGAGLYQLAHATSEIDKIDPTLRYWHEFTRLFLMQICAQDAIELPAHAFEAPIPSEAFSAMLIAAPPMVGGEYLALNTLTSAWYSLEKFLRAKAKSSTVSLRQFIEEKFPAWQQIGKVFFHLAENKKNPSLPFAFLATYANRVGATARVQHLPLGRALTDFASKEQKSALLSLLKPIHLAAEKSTLIRQLLNNGSIYTPQPWTPAITWRFLQDVPLFEESGIVVRMPDIWKSKKVSRPKIQITIGQENLPRMGLDSLLDFNQEMVLDGQVLTKEERQEILASSERLLFMKGRWVEVDREKLTQVLDYWQHIDDLIASEGMSFTDAMRLLAGTQLGKSSALTTALPEVEWSEVVAGKNLAEIMKTLRDPQNPDDTGLATVNHALLGKHLKANLRPYQLQGVQWLWLLYHLRLGACLADDMGLGKTLQVLALLTLIKYDKHTQKNRRPNLLVLPASLIGNWLQEIEKFAPHLTFLTAHRSALWGQELTHELQNNLSTYDLLITTYGSLQRCEEIATCTYNVMILDEAQAIKTPNTKQTLATKKIDAVQRLILTGTPIENRLMDLWSLFDFASPGLLGSQTVFQQYIKRLNSKNEDYGPLRRLVQPYILRRMKTDKRIITDLPDKTELNCYCNLTKQQTALYQEAVDHLKKSLEEGTTGIKRKGLVLSTLMRLKQICNHPSQLLGDGAYKASHSGKFLRLALLAETIANKQEKMLVFTQFREITTILADFLADLFEEPGLVLHGGTPVKKRPEIVSAFQADQGPPFVVLSLKAGGTGLNLTAASHVIHFDRWWNPAVENQATDRAFRIGQKRNVLVHKFLCQGTVEEKIDALIESKKALADEVLTAGGEAVLTEMSDADLINLITLDLNRALVEG